MKDNTTLEIQEPRTEDRYPDPGSETSRPAVTMSDLEQGQTPLFPETETGRFRSQWRAIQESFVDEPRRSVEQADQLVSTVISRLTEVFDKERERMQRKHAGGSGDATEGMRQALRQYRAFLDRLLTV